MIVLLEYRENSIKLEQGITSIGRGISCNIRFNDPAVSRRHIQISVEQDMAMVEELSTTNGSRINGQPLKGSRVLADGDELRIGHRLLRVRLLAETSESVDETTINRGPQWAGPPQDTVDNLTPPKGIMIPTSSTGHASGGLTEEDSAGSRPTPFSGSPRVEPISRPTPPQGISVVNNSILGDITFPQITEQNCRKCRAKLPIDADLCPKCGYRLPQGRPLSVTQRISIKDLERERRKAPRLPVDIPILYSSETLTFDAVARDLSHGGIFVASELLDPIGTPCNVTLLPDGKPPLSAAGVVCHVIVAETGEEGHPPGLGIKFTKLGDDTRNWIGTMLSQPV